MNDRFRAPKAVQTEARAAGHQLGAEALPVAELLTLPEFGPATVEWQQRIRSLIADRAALLPAEVTLMPDIPAVYGVNPNGFADSIMAADAAIDAAQNLLRDIDDPTVKQAYWLLCAADAALDEAQDALGVVDPDDEINESEPVTGDPADMGDMARDGDLADVEARTALIAAAEKRTFAAELRAVGDSGTRIGGYAARFDVEADGLSFREKIAPGAFRRSLDSGHDVFLLVNHDTTMVPLARRSAGTLAVTEDSTGLWIEADLDPTNPDAAALLSALRRGDVDKMSFAFTVADGGQRRSDEVRVLTDLDLHEVSVVTWPAYSASSVGMRSASTDLELRKRRAALLLNTRR